MHAYGFSIDAVTFFHSYLKRNKQNVRINNTHSTFKILLSGVPRNSILGIRLFNIFINGLNFWISFADDNTVSGTYYRENYFHFRARQSSCY